MTTLNIANSVREKGKNLIAFPERFVVIDTETTGLDQKYDDIIEISAIKVENNKIVDTFSVLINPGYRISSFITDLTGITNDMLVNAPKIENIIEDFYIFVKDYTIIGHNVNFDINFLYDSLIKFDIKLNNDFVDTMRIGRYLLKDLKHHRLADLANYYHIDIQGAHRALKDCEITLEVYKNMQKDILNNYNNLEEFIKNHIRTNYKLDARDLKTSNLSFDISHPLYNKCCVFTGTLDKMTRKEAMQIVLDLGGICSNSVTMETNYLVLGNNEYSPLVKDGKSNKLKKALQLKINGYDIEIISENVFYDMINEKNK